MRLLAAVLATLLVFVSVAIAGQTIYFDKFLLGRGEYVRIHVRTHGHADVHVRDHRTHTVRRLAVSNADRIDRAHWKRLRVKVRLRDNKRLLVRVANRGHGRQVAVRVLK